MAVIRVRDKDGNIKEITTIKGDKGDSYVLTEADKQEIASMVEVSGGGTVDMSNYYTKEETDNIVGDIEALLGGI